MPEHAVQISHLRHALESSEVGAFEGPERRHGCRVLGVTGGWNHSSLAGVSPMTRYRRMSGPKKSTFNACCAPARRRPCLALGDALAVRRRLRAAVGGGGVP